jgi:hypothetical protein
MMRALPETEPMGYHETHVEVAGPFNEWRDFNGLLNVNCFRRPPYFFLAGTACPSMQTTIP